MAENPTTRVFISWSGEQSRKVAAALHRYLPCMIRVTVFMSEHDIGSGRRWARQLSEALADSNFGVMCLTPDNINSPWILFEAGALTKHLEMAACGLLCAGLEPTHISGPLSQFQHQRFDRSGILRMLAEVNAGTSAPLETEQVRLVLDKWWSDLAQAYEEAMQVGTATVKERDVRELLGEILASVRDLEDRSDDRVPSVPRSVPLDIAGGPLLERRWGPWVLANDAVLVEVDQPFATHRRYMAIGFEQGMSVQDFLNRVFRSLPAPPPSYTYGTAWVLRDNDSGKALDNLGSAWSKGHSMAPDRRSLVEVGIRAGMRLAVVSLEATRSNTAMEPSAPAGP